MIIKFTFFGGEADHPPCDEVKNAMHGDTLPPLPNEPSYGVLG